jgi:short-subunit dehydrogenase involved in D-alanine esterification of teichoic acids
VRNNVGKLKGNIALIAGGACGTGLGMATQFANDGPYVFITGRRDPELAAAVSRCGLQTHSA